MVLINVVFALFSLLWLVSQITQAELDPEFWFALAFTLLCAANVVGFSREGKRQPVVARTKPRSAEPKGRPVAGRPVVPADYGVFDPDQGHGLASWQEVDRNLAEARVYWVCTTRPDGRPHTTPVWGVWLEEMFYFGTHRQSRKARNLAVNPYLTMHLASGEQVVIVEGVVEEVDETEHRSLVYEAYATKYDLPVDEPYKDPDPVFALRPKLAFAWSGSEFAASATRWTFEA